MCDLHGKVFKSEHELLHIMGIGETAVVLKKNGSEEFVLYGQPTRREEQVKRLLCGARMYGDCFKITKT
jgi:3'-phosphoadenosine 5'-phosphosulfate sulfotransferase